MRRLAITKRVSLEGLDPSWGSDCYALVTSASYAEFIEVAGLDEKGKSNVDLMQFEVDFVKKHFVSGKANFVDDKGDFVLDDLLAEDIDGSKELTDFLYEEILGVNLDPKASSTSTETSSTSEASTSTNS